MGLLDFMNSPTGQGLLSAVAAGAAGARKGTPWNNFGRGALGGLAGYADAQDQLQQKDENAFQRQFRQMQLDQARQQMADREAYRAQFTPDTRKPFEADNPFGEDLGNLQTGTAPSFAGQEIDPKLAAVAPFLEPKEFLTALGGGGDQMFGKIMPHAYTPESLSAYQKSRNFADLKPIAGGANFGNVNPGQFTPESLAVYAQTGNYADLVPRVAPMKINTGASEVIIEPTTNRVLGTYAKGLAPSEMPSVIAAQEEAKQGAVLGAKTAGARQEKEAKAQADAESINSLASEADRLLDKASSGKAEAAISSGKSFVGISDEKTQADASLKVIAGQLVGKVPRFEGPQSDADRLLYEQMAGRVGDPTVPTEDRRAALKTMQRLHSKYDQPQKARPSASALPKFGEVRNGYRFVGGKGANPNDAKNWRKVEQ